MDYKEKVIAILNSKELSKEQKEKLEEIFPELKESEDEKIREELIGHINNMKATTISSLREKQFESWIAWLEKQGKSNPYSGVSFKYNGHTWGMCARDNGVEILIDRKIKERIFLDNKPQGKSALKAINEEKVDNQNCVEPIDNIEPKFHEGDWVVYNNEICQIVTREEGCNKLVTVFGIEKELVNERNLSTARLWNIQDAKEGDVLVASDDSIFLFADLDDCACKYYVALTTDNVVNFSKGLGHYWETSRGVHPATKEQRTILFQKIKEAGYEWNPDTKELKKIEQKPAWSKEDEEIHIKCICAMRASACGFPEEEKFVEQVDNWLKSLKDRVLPQQEWSDEDERIRQDIENLIHFALRDGSAVSPAADTTKEDAISWIQSLRPQKQWKPSEEQMKALSNAGNSFRPFEEGHKVLWSLYNDLKKLREE